jgi:hypothetical protein
VILDDRCAYQIPNQQDAAHATKRSANESRRPGIMEKVFRMGLRYPCVAPGRILDKNPDGMQRYGDFV